MPGVLLIKYAVSGKLWREAGIRRDWRRRRLRWCRYNDWWSSFIWGVGMTGAYSLRVWNENYRKRRESLSAILPDVVGPWKAENNDHDDRGGSVPDDGIFTTTLEMQPTTTPTEIADPIYLSVAGSVAEESVIAPLDYSPKLQTTSPHTSILVDPTSLERRNNRGQVCLSIRVHWSVHPHIG